MKHYVVISADCHAGPNSPVYRDFLDPKYHDDFDDELAERQALIDERRAAAGTSTFIGDDEFKEEWFGEDDEGNSLHEIGLRGGWDAADPRQGARQRRRDRARSCSPVPTPPPARMGAPFGAGFNPVATQEPRAPARRRARVQPLGGRALPGEPGAARRPDRGADPRRPRRRDRRDPPRARRRAHRRHHHPAAVGRPRVVHELPLRPGVGGVRGARRSRCTATPVPAPHEDYGEVRGWMSVYGYETIFFTARPLWFMLLTGVFERFPRLQAWRSPKRGASGRPTCCGALDMMAMREHGMRKMVDTRGITHDAAERVLRPQRARSARRTRAAASSRGATRSASATSCGATTSRTPRARGRTRVSS